MSLIVVMSDVLCGWIICVNSRCAFRPSRIISILLCSDTSPELLSTPGPARCPGFEFGFGSGLGFGSGFGFGEDFGFGFGFGSGFGFGFSARAAGRAWGWV